MAAEGKKVVDPVMGGEEALSVPGRLEALHLPLSPSRRLVRVLGPVVQSLVLPVLDAGHDLPLRNLVARQLVGDHDPRGTALLLQQLVQQPEGRLLVAPALDEDVEHAAVLVHRTPEPVPLAPGRHHDLVAVPLVSSRGQPAPDLVRKALAELQPPLPHGFVADDDAACGEQLIHIAQAQGKAEVEPNGVADDLGREAMAGVAGSGGRCHPVRLPAPYRCCKPAGR